ncbi:MAG: TrmH family RNA methyltransferase [Bacteroidales bacterium]
MDDLSLNTKRELLEYLSGFITEKRRKRLEEIVTQRTRYFTVVIENIFQSHNASAVLRSCECFGVQNVHIIENENVFKTHPDIALGSDKWLNLFKYKSENGTRACLTSLKKQGYRIVATSPHKNSYNLETLPMDSKFALVFGTEMDGISSVVDEMTDVYVKIPMSGFTESLNISVSAAVCLYALSERIRKSELSWKLTDSEQIDLLIQWVKNTVKKPEVLEKAFFNRK